MGEESRRQERGWCWERRGAAVYPPTPTFVLCVSVPSQGVSLAPSPTPAWAAGRAIQNIPEGQRAEDSQKQAARLEKGIGVEQESAFGCYVEKMLLAQSLKKKKKSFSEVVTGRTECRMLARCILGELGSWAMPTSYKHPHIGPGALRPKIRDS